MPLDPTGQGLLPKGVEANFLQFGLGENNPQMPTFWHNKTWQLHYTLTIYSSIFEVSKA